VLSSFGFDLKALEVFVQIVETGNMTQSGQHLGMSQSSISQTLAGLEESLRAELIDRSVRPMEVTTARRYFYDRAKAILHEARWTSQEMRKADYKMLRHVKVALVDSIITSVGEPLINVIRKRTQDSSLLSGLSHLHSHMLLSRQADIIISDDAVDDYHNLSRHLILKEPFVLAIPNSYKGKKDIRSILSSLDLIRYSSTSLIGQDVERYLRRLQIEPTARLQLDNSYAITSGVVNGIGCAITTPLCLFQAGIKEHQMRLLPLDGDFFRELTLVSRENELGDLPQIIARDCRKILQETFIAETAKHYPWLSPLISTAQ